MGRGTPVPPHVVNRYVKLREEGYSRAAATKLVGVSYAWAQRLDQRMTTASSNPSVSLMDRNLPEPIPPNKLSKDAQRALDDFDYFRARYFGRLATPWQADAANQMVERLERPGRDFVVVNCPPGSGKSTLFTLEIPAWLICRRRSIRMILGSRTQRQAATYAGRLRNALGRVLPVPGDPELIDKGYAVQATGCLARDFGRFRSGEDLWRREEFIVLQNDGSPVEEKEPTVTAFGMDSGSLGWRVNFGVWDDLVDRRTIRTLEAREDQQNWWETEGETRLEPDGVMVLQGQRMSTHDLYRHCLNMEGASVDDAGDEEPARKYDHIVYKAHYEENCTRQHSTDAPPYPEGCLLDPVRLPWKEVQALKKNRANKFRVLYQQEDVDPDTVLVQKDWISGGTDSNGFLAPGCLDPDRGLWELPKGLSQPSFTVAMADPSPTKYWGLECLTYHPATEQRFLMDIVRQKMSAPELLDWDYNNGVFTGIMEEWQQLSKAKGCPIRYWIIEKNAAQRFLLQYDHVKRWMALNSVQIIGHETHRNKSDPELGIESIAPHFQFGRVRLPYKGDARLASMKLIEEVTTYPDCVQDDLTLAYWFFEWNVNRIYVPPQVRPVRLRRPTWMRKPVRV